MVEEEDIVVGAILGLAIIGALRGSQPAQMQVTTNQPSQPPPQAQPQLAPEGATAVAKCSSDAPCIDIPLCREIGGSCIDYCDYGCCCKVSQRAPTATPPGFGGSLPYLIL